MEGNEHASATASATVQDDISTDLDSVSKDVPVQRLFSRKASSNMCHNWVTTGSLASTLNSYDDGRSRVISPPLLLLLDLVGQAKVSAGSDEEV